MYLAFQQWGFFALIGILLLKVGAIYLGHILAVEAITDKHAIAAWLLIHTGIFL